MVVNDVKKVQRRFLIFRQLNRFIQSKTGCAASVNRNQDILEQLRSPLSRQDLFSQQVSNDGNYNGLILVNQRDKGIRQSNRPRTLSLGLRRWNQAPEDVPNRTRNTYACS